MLISSHYLVAIALVIYAPLPAWAQSISEKVWAVFAYSVHGESTPRVAPPPWTLTAYGANGLHTAGSSFRDRYIMMYPQAVPPDLQIQNLSPYSLQPDEVSVLSAADQPAIASAQAFMQGLYPPVDTSYGAPYIDPSSQLSNGSYVTYPLHGYQYPAIVTLGLSDPGSPVVAGQSSCPRHQTLVEKYNASPEAGRLAQESKSFYANLYDQLLADTFQPSSVGYTDAQDISEYLGYQSIHNASFSYNLDLQDIDRARWLADQYTFATSGNLSSGAKIRAIAGRTLASHILGAFSANIQHVGMQKQVSLAFGGYEPAVALASLMGLASTSTANFYSRPVAGASLIFELFSYESEQFPPYPNLSDLFVRFLLHNGTDSYTKFVPYPLFGHGPSNIAIPLSEFRAEMESFALGSTKEWCRLCKSTAVFCDGVLRSSSSDGMDPAATGIISAVAAFLFLVAMVITWSFTCGPYRRRRRMFSGKSKRHGKMASDADVTFESPSWGDRVSGAQEPAGDDPIGGTVTKGHSRSGSWEMGQRTEASCSTSVQSSPLRDEDEEWQLPTTLEPVRVREYV